MGAAFDETGFDALDLDFDRQGLGDVPGLDTDAVLILRDGARTVLATLTYDSTGWMVYDNNDGSITVKIAEDDGEVIARDAGEQVTRAMMMRVADLPYIKNADEAPYTWANGTREQWKQASRRVWSLKNYKPAGPYTAPVVDDFLLLESGGALLLESGVELALG